MQTVPNIFILGAPKCGTTALAKWLGEHRGIYASPVKEPHHFSTEYCLTPDRADYESLYRGWPPGVQWAVDASVWQLFSPTAVPNILREQPDAHFIVMLRNPLQMIASMHRQQLFNGNELEPDLRKALELNDRRAAGEGLCVLAGYPPDHLAYYHSCALGWQVERFMSLVEATHRHIILHDDLAQNPEKVLTETYDFIGIDPEMPTSLGRINVAKVRRFPGIDKAAKSFGDWKHRRGITLKFGFLSWLRRANSKQQPILPLDEDLISAIRERMAEDVRRLGGCVGRDLSHWLDIWADTA